MTVDIEESNLVRHARDELRRAGMFDEDADYGPALAHAILDVVAAFASAGHSGGSAALSLAILERLLRFEPLTPLTSDPGEWIDRSAESGIPMWQNRRDSKVFSHDGGATWDRLGQPGDECTKCGGTGVVQVPVCAPSCTLLRHAGDCPRPRLDQCDRCAGAELGENRP